MIKKFLEENKSVTRYDAYCLCETLQSTLSNLAEYVNFLSTNLANGGQIDAIYTDFAKAFDKVAHIILLRKLDQFPINNCIKAWIYSYLTERNQIVCVNGAKSELIKPTSSPHKGQFWHHCSFRYS